MNLFQWITLPIVVALLAWELADRRRRAFSTGFWLIRCLVWIAAGATIADPNLLQGVADAMGIHRGTDVVLYVFVLLFVAFSFYFYWQNVVLQRQITLLVRHLAVQAAQRGPGETALTAGESTAGSR
jgi:hypothetical protein